MKIVTTFLLGMVFGGFLALALLIGHMEWHDRMYHQPGSKFGTNGVTPFNIHEK